MDSLKEQLKKGKDYVKDKFSNNYRSFRIRYQGTKAYKNIETLIKYQNIYYELINK